MKATGDIVDYWVRVCPVIGLDLSRDDLESIRPFLEQLNADVEEEQEIIRLQREMRAIDLDGSWDCIPDRRPESYRLLEDDASLDKVFGLKGRFRHRSVIDCSELTPAACTWKPGGKRYDPAHEVLFFYEDVEVEARKSKYDRFRVHSDRRPELSGPVVYYIQAVTGGPVKIGKAVDVFRRFPQIQTMSPVPLRLLATEPYREGEDGDASTEGYRHAQFYGLRLYGEWFRDDPRLLAHIAENCRPSDLLLMETLDRVRMSDD